jgi:hypothetical protein
MEYTMKQRMRAGMFGVILLAAAACASQPATTTPATAATPRPATGATANAGGAANAGAAANAGGAAGMTVYSGVYSAAQATRGNQLQARECGSCHSPSDWAQGRVLASWNGQSAWALVDHIRTIMPMDSPGRLTLQQYTDIFAYILQLNNIPAGQAELPATEEGLKQITVQYRS